MNKEEVEHYITALPIRERVIAHLALFAGMRPGEILALQRRHISADGCQLSIEQRVYRGDIDTPKTDSSTRLVAIPPRTAHQLREWMRLLNEAASVSYRELYAQSRSRGQGVGARR
jgi:integrase